MGSEQYTDSVLGVIHLICALLSLFSIILTGTQLDVDTIFSRISYLLTVSPHLLF